MEGRNNRDGNETSNEFYWEVRFLKCIILAPIKLVSLELIMDGISLAILRNATKN